MENLFRDFVRGKIKHCAFVVAHPDDETIMAASRIVRTTHPLVVHVTDGGANISSARRVRGARADYVRTRRREALAAMRLAGVSARDVRCLGAVDFEAAFEMPGLAKRLASLLERTNPPLVVTHAYEGGHPDHDATALVVRAALELLRSRRKATPLLVEAACYQGSRGRLATNEFVHDRKHKGHRIDLSHADRALKRKMFDRFVSQEALLKTVSIGFECFRVGLEADFSKPPHSGPLHYEQWGSPFTGAVWRKLAGLALDTLGLALA